MYDYEFVKQGLGEWVAWSTKLVDAQPIPKDAQFNSIIVPTVDTVRTTYLMDVCVKHEKPCLFVGPTGTGKSVYIQVRGCLGHTEPLGRLWSHFNDEFIPEMMCTFG